MRRQNEMMVIAVVAVVAGCAGMAGIQVGSAWGFNDATAASGLDYAARASGVGNGNSGVYATDFDNDGWTDILAIGGEEPVLFENTGGKFERSDALPDADITVQGALFFDADGDGWEDLLLLPRRGEAVFLENDRGSFVRRDVGFGNEFGVAVGASAADYDGDGDLDVFVIQYGDWAERTPAGYRHADGGHVADDDGAPNLLFENTDGEFSLVDDAGIEGHHWSLATSFVDLTGDGRPDIHVANDFNSDVLYRNEGDGSFERIVLGAETARNGMSSEVGDFDRDGRPDIFVTNIYFPLAKADLSEEKRERLRRYFAFVLRSKRIKGNNLLINEGEANFSFESEAYGVRKGGWGWAAAFVDFDNDMDRDLFHATQMLVRLDEEQPTFTYPMFFERGDEKFERRDAAALGFEETDGRGVTTLDYDRDGDMDLVVSTYDGGFKLYENTVDSLDDRNSVQIRVVEENGKTTAVGAVVRVEVDGTTRSAVQNAKADYQSQDSRVLHFGLGANERVDRIAVMFPNGPHRTIEDVPANQRVVIRPNGSVRMDPLG